MGVEKRSETALPSDDRSSSTQRFKAPEGLRWANGGGVGHIGECNGYHLALPDVSGTLCGRYGPYTPPDPRSQPEPCKNCIRIAKARRFDV